MTGISYHVPSGSNDPAHSICAVPNNVIRNLLSFFKHSMEHAKYGGGGGGLISFDKLSVPLDYLHLYVSTWTQPYRTIKEQILLLLV